MTAARLLLEICATLADSEGVRRIICTLWHPSRARGLFHRFDANAWAARSPLTGQYRQVTGRLVKRRKHERSAELLHASSVTEREQTPLTVSAESAAEIPRWDGVDALGLFGWGALYHSIRSPQHPQHPQPPPSQPARKITRRAWETGENVIEPCCGFESAGNRPALWLWLCFAWLRAEPKQARRSW